MLPGTCKSFIHLCLHAEHLRLFHDNRNISTLPFLYSNLKYVLQSKILPVVKCELLTVTQSTGKFVLSPLQPDLAPSNFHLFPKIKTWRTTLCFGNDEELQICVTVVVASRALVVTGRAAASGPAVPWRYLDQNLLDMSQPDLRHFILQIALKCADISNPCRPWEVSRKWSQKVCEEFYRQGDYERQLNLPVTSLCDRLSTSVPKIQAGFFRFVVAPLLEEWHRFLGTPLSQSMMGHLRDNQERWENLLQQELAEETRTEISEAEEIPEDDLDNGVEEEESRRLSVTSTGVGDRVGRRHSVPLSVTRAPVLPLTVIRRESLPVVDQRRRFTLTVGPLLHLEEEEDLQLSLMSSGSSGGPSECPGSTEERPVSAENLLPDLSIASITTSVEASRLSSVLHGTTLAPPSRLTRQQTFPPLQPYVRVRYMSTTGELNADTSSSSSDRSRTGEPLKRDSSDDSSGEKAVKMAKLNREKENVDPQHELDMEIASLKSRRNIPQSLARRRGSAPVGLLRMDDQAVRHANDRRGSVPTAIAIAAHSGRRCSLSSRPLRHIQPGTLESRV
ncbi:cAMP-specific 3',5'-cyclic phosphodiesterase 7B [Homalodisca vitripennis]|nr:cAMP-specific 3',5'-cyclic phosphodiesterase 7B [Homalodisca vitripennis]